MSDIKNSTGIDDSQATEIVEKAKRKRPDRSEALKVHTAPGDNTKYLNHALAALELPKVNTSSREEVRERSIWYLQHCADDDMKPTVTGYANALGISRQQLHNICNGKQGSGEAIDTIKKIKSIIEEQMENYMMNGKINPVSGIFLLKNNFVGYVDKQEIELKASPIGDNVNREELAERYADSLPEVEETVTIDVEADVN